VFKSSTLRGIGWLALLLSAPIAQADVTFTVNTTDDRLDDDTSDGVCHTSVDTCGLRAAIMQANHLSAPGVTTINVPAGTYTLTRPLAGANGEDNGDLNLTSPLSPDQTIAIVGAGATSTIIDANQIDGVMSVAAMRTASISRIGIRNGNRVGDQSQGGGIRNTFGSLSIIDCVIENNRSFHGGGISSSGPLGIVHSTIRSNIALHEGGGININSGYIVVRDSTIHSNGADNGGAIFNRGALHVTNSTISSNYANANGGGIYGFEFTALYNTTVVGNDAGHASDQSAGVGGGVYARTRFVVSNSLIAENTRQSIRFYNDCNGLLEAYGRNYFFDLSGCNIPNPGSRLVSLNTFGPLQDNGGPTWTHALLPGSEAISTELFPCVDENNAALTADQRGAARTAGGICDAGAFEYEAIMPPQISFQSSFE
jgi:hypothetical protein